MFVKSPKQFKAGFTKALFLSTALAFVAVTAAPAVMAAAAGVSGCAVPSPTGSWADTFTYDKTTGLWQNQYYTWNPQNCQYSTTPDPQTFTYNWGTGRWDGSQWDYIASTGKWQLDKVSVKTPPDGAILITPPNPATQQQTNNSNNSGSSGNGSDPSITNNSTTNLTNNTNNQINVNNNVATNGQSGNATVSQNTTAGDATSGNVVTTADVNNLLQSDSALVGAATFVDNINGNVNGNLIVDPSSIVQPASGSNSNVTSNNDLTDVNNISTNASINNTLNLNAQSGNANVTQNTSAGNATSGSADAVANVVNMINSMIASGQSFVGVINILGDLNGNILMPQQFLNGLIASNAPSSTVTVSKNNNATLNAAFNNGQNIVNDVTSNAQSGNANVSENTNAGNATSGNATTQVTIFNLTGENVVASNVMLVFVNVLGQWVGLLMNAPAGSTAAAFGSNVTENSTNNVNANLNVKNNESINNNLNLNAKSGNANVSENTNAGNATSGNANTAANILNLEGTSFNASGWFGILFINVFGNWTGSFGLELPITKVNPPSGSSTSPLTELDNIVNSTPPQSLNQLVASISAHSSGSSTRSTSGGNNVQLVSSKQPGSTFNARAADATSKAVASHEHNDSLVIGGVLVGCGVVLFVIERVIRKRDDRALAKATPKK